MTVFQSISLFLAIAVAILVPFVVGARKALLAITKYPEWWSETEEEYKKTFHPEDDKTPIEASSFFNMDRLYQIALERKLWFARLYLNQGNDLAGTLVGLGIFGTFLGLSIGLGGFDTSDTETIRISVQQLLNGIRTAFSSSLVGIGASVIFTHFIHNPFMARIETALAERCNELDEIHYSAADIAVVDQLRLSHEEYRKQTSALSSFSDTVNAALERTIAELTEKQFKPMNDQMELAVKEFIGVAEEIKTLAGNTQTTVVEKVVADLQNGLEKLLGEFLGWFSEEAKEEMRQLMEGLGSIRDALDTVPERIQESLDRVSDTVTAQTELFAETVERAKGQTEKTVAALDQLSAVSERFDQAGHTISGALETVDEVWRQMGATVTKQREQIQGVLDALSSTSTTLSASVKMMTQAIESFSETEQQITRVFTVVEESIATYSSSVERSLDGYLKAYTQETTDMLHRLAQTFENLREEIEMLNTMDRERIDSVTQVFSESARSITAIKEVLDKHVAHSSQLNSLLGEHLQVIEQGYNKFDSTAVELSEMLDLSATATAEKIERSVTNVVEKFDSSAVTITERLEGIAEKMNEKGRGLWRR